MGMVQKRLSEAAKKRLRAGRLLQSGKNCAEVALATGVARQTGSTCSMKAVSKRCEPFPSAGALRSWMSGTRP